jgi:hypothetical protein
MFVKEGVELSLSCRLEREEEEPRVSWMLEWEEEEEPPPSSSMLEWDEEELLVN